MQKLATPLQLEERTAMADQTLQGKVAIVGSGMIGKSWSVLFARGGYQVVLYDVLFTDTSTQEAALTAVRQIISTLENDELLWPGQTLEVLASRITTSNDLGETLNGAVYVQECVPENVDLKRKVFMQLDKLATSDMLLASSTSCIVPSSFTSELNHRSQCIVAHPVNPPHYIPVVEVVPSEWTDKEVVQRTLEVLKKIGQAPVVVKKEVDGFIVNRLQYAIIMEAWRLVEDGVASPEDIDTAVRDGFGLRFSFMGPFDVMHTNANGVEDYCKLYGAGIARVCREQVPVREMDKPGPALEAAKTAMESKVPLDKLKEMRSWRDKRLSALVKHKKEMAEKEKMT